MFDNDFYKFLFNIYVSSDQLSDFVKKISLELNNPIALIDTNFNIIATSDNNLYLDSFWDDSIQNGRWNITAIKIIEKEFKDGSLFKIISTLGEHRRLFIKLYYNELFVGYCAILEINNNVEEILNKYKDEINSVAILIAKTFFLYSLNINYKSSDDIFIDTLLSRGFENRKIYLEKLKNSSFVKGNFYLLLIDISDVKKGEEKNFTEEFNSLLKRKETIYKDQFLIYVLKEDELTFEKQVDEILFTYKVRGLLSTKINDLYYLKNYYDGMKIFFSMLKKSNNEYKLINIHKYRQIIPFVTSDKNFLFSSIDENINKIYFYDNKNKSNYIDTLYIYLISNDSINEVSKKLYIHKNTVLYRLNKLKEEFNIDYSNANNRLVYLNSILIIYFLSNTINKIEV